MAALNVDIKATELDKIKKLFQLLQDIKGDDRIPVNVRVEIIERAGEIIAPPVE